jgi:hypothetical protein
VKRPAWLSTLSQIALDDASSRRALVLVWTSGLALLAGSIALSWNSHPYWMDAEEYALFLGLGRWAVHPPGYILFMASGRLLYALGWTNPYASLQVLTLGMTLGGMLVLYRLLRLVVGPVPSSILVFTFSLSWVPLLINHTGTSSTSDFVTVPLLLLTAVRVSEQPSRSASVRLALAMVLCGGFRLTTLLMMGPLLGVVLWRNRRRPHVWGAFAASVLGIGLLQLLTIRDWGGWDLYAFMVWKENFVNRTYVESGFAPRFLFNLGRSLLWFVLATLGLWFALPRLRSAKPWGPRQKMLLLYGALATAGPFAACALYLCEHPGYLAPALAGFYLCVAVAWDRADGRLGFCKWPAVAVMASLLLFFGLRFHRTLASPAQAVANGLLLQYSADAARHAHFLSTVEWLRVANELSPGP